MRWGVGFLVWVVAVLYLADGCMEYVRIWANRPDMHDRIREPMTQCFQGAGLRLAGITLALVVVHVASGRWLAQREARVQQADGDATPPDA